MPKQELATGSVGAPISRIDGREKVMGQARYAEEAPVPKAAFGYILPSSIAKGEIASMDTSMAERSLGVIAVLTPLNMPKLAGGYSGDQRSPLSDMAIHYGGQHVAVVVADTPERARDAASLIQIRYRDVPATVDLHAPESATNAHGSFFGRPLAVHRGDVEVALKEANLTLVHETYVTPVETHNPMEMSATVALWEGDDRLTVWDATQGVSSSHEAFTKAFGLKPENVRVYCPYTGGGFGGKGEQWPHKFLAVAAAKLAKRPVRLVLTRAQMFTSSGHRPVCEQELTLGATPDGKLMALRHVTTTQSSPTGTHVETCGMGTSAVLYETANLHVDHILQMVDLPPATWMRAPGETPGMFALESAMDELAWALKMDPVKLRVVNHADKSPENGLPWSSKHLKECYEKGAEKFGWSRRSATPGSMKTRDGRPLGFGMASATYSASKFGGTARIRLYKEGLSVRAVAAAASQDLGTGTWTVGTQMTATLTGLPPERVKFEIGDSDLPQSGQSGGSTTAASLAQALGDASESLKFELLKFADGTPLAGLDSKGTHFKDGRLTSISEPRHSVALSELVAKSGKPFVEGITVRERHLQVGGEDYGANGKKYAFKSFGAHFVEVQIDDPVPLVRVTRVVSVMDVGKILNPKTARSQVIGGVVMGLGQVLMEDTHFDHRTGRVVNDNFADYAVPVNPDIHSLEVEFIDIPDVHFNPLGCRGVGEIGITGVAAAVANAVYHATGKRIRDLPITPDKLL